MLQVHEGRCGYWLPAGGAGTVRAAPAALQEGGQQDHHDRGVPLNIFVFFNVLLM